MISIQEIEKDFRKVLDSAEGYKYRDVVVSHLKNLPHGLDLSLFETVIEFLGSYYFPSYSHRLSSVYLATYFEVVERLSHKNQGASVLFNKFTLIVAQKYGTREKHAQCIQALTFISTVYNYKIDQHRVEENQLRKLAKCVNKPVIKCCKKLLNTAFYESESSSIFHNLFFYPLAFSNSQHLYKLVVKQVHQTDKLLGLRKILAILDLFNENDEVEKSAHVVEKKITKLLSTSSMRLWMNQFYEFSPMTSWTVYLQVAEGQLKAGERPEHSPNNVRIWMSNYHFPDMQVQVSKEVRLKNGSTTSKYHTIDYTYRPNEEVKDFKNLIEGSLRDLSMNINWDILKVNVETNLVRREKAPVGISSAIKKWVLSQ